MDRDFELVSIAAVAEDNVIGHEGDMPWRTKDEWTEMRKKDMARFRENTAGHPVIMGRLTYESIPASYRPLDKRLNIVLTSEINYWDKQQPNVPVVGNIPGALYIISEGYNPICTSDSLEGTAEMLRAAEDPDDNIDISRAYIMGGERVYKEGMPLVDKLLITHIHAEFPGDTYFPEIGDEWEEAEREDHDGFSFVTYLRKRD